MAYAIGNIIYGINLTHSPYLSKPDPFKEFRDEISDIMDARDEGFDSAYSGNGDSQPEWFGLSMSEFDECSDLTGAKMIEKCTATDDHRAQYANLLEKLRANPDISNELKAMIERTEPTVHIIWGTS